MPTQPPRARVDARARSRALQEEILELIHARRLAPGDPLPTEIELVEQLGVGRNTVREALKVLQATGIIDVRHGYGMFVARNRLDGMAIPLEFHARLSLRRSGHEALELVDVRQALESGLIGSACALMDERSRAAVLAAVECMERDAEAGRPLREADRDFHRALFEPLGNRLLSNLLEVFWSAYARVHEEVDSHGRSEMIETARHHRAIYEAVAAGDTDRAAQLLVRHFDGIRALIAETTAE